MPKRRRTQQPTTDPQGSAQAAGLRYVSDATPGIRRRGAGRGFSYVAADGRVVRNPRGSDDVPGSRHHGIVADAGFENFVGWPAAPGLNPRLMP